MATGGWPSWGEILPVLVSAIVVLGAVGGIVWGLTNTIKSISKEVADNSAKTAADDLYARLKGNDFKHVEDRITRTEDRLSNEIKAVKTDLKTEIAGVKTDLKADIKASEIRLLDAIRENRARVPQEDPKGGR